jgi:hypothetical protein
MHVRACRRGTCFSDLAAPSLPGSSSSGSSTSAAGAGHKAGTAAFKPIKRPASLLGNRPGSSSGAGSNSQAAVAGGGSRACLFDHTAPGAVVVNAAQWQDGRGMLRPGRPVVPVVRVLCACVLGWCLLARSVCIVVFHPHMRACGVPRHVCRSSTPTWAASCARTSERA